MALHHQKRFVVGIFAGCVLALGGGCGDASRMFTGMWESEEVVASAWIQGRPLLALGHFGPELTGIVYFRDEDGLPTGTCTCAFVDQQDVDLGEQTFVATTTLCEPDPSRWIWRLTLDDEGADPRLVGDVRRADDESEETVPVSFVLDDEFVPDDRRECP